MPPKRAPAALDVVLSPPVKTVARVVAATGTYEKDRPRIRYYPQFFNLEGERILSSVRLAIHVLVSVEKDPDAIRITVREQVVRYFDRQLSIVPASIPPVGPNPPDGPAPAVAGESFPAPTHRYDAHLSNANQLIKTHIIISILYRYRPNCICAEGAGGGCSCFRHGEDPPPPPTSSMQFCPPHV